MKSRHLIGVMTSKYLICHETAIALSRAMAAIVVIPTLDKVFVISCVTIQIGSIVCRLVTVKLLMACINGPIIPVRHILHINIPATDEFI